MSESKVRQLENEKLELQRTVVKLKQELIEKEERLGKMHEAVSAITKLIEEVVKKDEQIQLNKRELEMIFNASTDYVAVLDKDHKIKRVNLSFCALLGITPDEAMGVDFYTYFDDLPADFDKSQIKREDFVETTYLSRRFNKWFILRSRMLKQECDPLVYIHITKDVTRDFQ